MLIHQCFWHLKQLVVMIRLKPVYFLLLILCAAFFVSTDKSGNGVIVRDGCLGPALKRSYTEVFIDKSTKQEIKIGVYRARGFVAAPDMTHFFADFIVKTESHLRDYEMLMEEARILSELASNPETSAYVPKVYAIEEDGWPAIVMEDISGGQTPFVQIKGDDTYLDFREQLLVLRAVVQALSAIHKAGYVHSDVYPANIFYRFEILPDGSERVRAKIIDFELSRKTSSSSYPQYSMDDDHNIIRTYHEFGDLPLEELIIKNVCLDIKRAGKYFLEFFRDHCVRGASYKLSASELEMLEGVEEREDFIPMLKTISSPLVRKMLIRMLLPSPEEGQYTSLEPILDVLNEALSQASVPESAILCAA